MPFLFEAQYHNMIEFGYHAFSVDNLRFEPISEIEPEVFGRPRTATGRLVINVPKSIATQDKAEDYFHTTIDRLSKLLSFFANGSVYFQRYDCYEIIDDRMEHRGTKYLGGRVGDPPRVPVVYSFHLGDFVSCTLPLLNDQHYCERTGLWDALVYQWEANCFMRGVAYEIQYLVWWLVLELMAHRYYDANKKNFLLDLKEDERTQRIDQFIGDLKALTQTHKIEDCNNEIVGAVKYAFSNESIRRRMRYFLRGNGFELYEDVVVGGNDSMYNVRSKITHGARIEDHHKKIELFLKLKRLVEKATLKLLNYYDNKRAFVHSAYLNEDLRASE